MMNLGLTEDNIMNLNNFETYIKTDYARQLIDKVNSYVQIYQQRQEEFDQTVNQVTEKKRSLNDQQYLMGQDINDQDEMVILSYKNQQCFENLVNTISRKDIKLISSFTKRLLAFRFSQQNELKKSQLLFWWNV